MPEKCPCENDVAVLLERTANHDKTLYNEGNGIVKRVIVAEQTIINTNENVSEMHDDLKKIATAMSGLEQSREVEIEINRQREKNAVKRSRSWERVGIAFAAGGTIFGVVFMVLNYLKNLG